MILFKFWNFCVYTLGLYYLQWFWYFIPFKECYVAKQTFNFNWESIFFSNYEAHDFFENADVSKLKFYNV